MAPVNASLTLPGRVEMQASDWSKDGQAILGACRFNQSERYSTCLVPVSTTTETDDPSFVIASDPKRNLYNQRFSPDQRWITFLAHDLLYASTSTVYVIPAAGGAWRAITDGAWFDDKPRCGPRRTDAVLRLQSNGRRQHLGPAIRRNATGTPMGEPFAVTSFRSAQFQLTPRTVQMDIAITTTHLLLPMSESRSDIWMLDHTDR